RVRPPRLGGNKTIGVFASRSPYRPNPIGLSVVQFSGIRKHKNRLFLDIKGADIIDGTPVLDIKPYIPYSDSIPQAAAGYAERSPEAKLQVMFSDQAQKQIQQFSNKYPQLETFIRQVIAQDPRPAYACDDEPGKQYGVKLLEFDVQWRVAKGIAEVISLEQ
ncbi:MAG: tRNA (N6-threonylcarbamoyladenosine(37)-N6)-methyltransferase TrmO, partial [Gammaproteobacteria bacterium]